MCASICMCVHVSACMYVCYSAVPRSKATGWHHTLWCFSLTIRELNSSLPACARHDLLLFHVLIGRFFSPSVSYDFTGRFFPLFLLKIIFFHTIYSDFLLPISSQIDLLWCQELVMPLLISLSPSLDDLTAVFLVLITFDFNYGFT